MNNLSLKIIFMVGVAFLLVVGGVFVWNKNRIAQPVDLGVVSSNSALQSFLEKLGPRSHGTVAGGIPVGNSFSNAEFTSFFVSLVKERKLPIGDVQVRFHDDAFEASVVTQGFLAKEDFYMKGSVQLKESRKIHVTIHELKSKNNSLSTEMKKEVEQKLNQGIQNFFDRYGPDERFLNIQRLQLKENQLSVEGIFPLEFFPDSKIRF